MNATDPRPPEPVPALTSAPSPARLLWVVACISAAVLGFEISLMRLLLVASWHHFAFLVISIALLGFGASGTALCLARAWLLPRGRAGLFALSLAAAVLMPVCFGLSQHVPIEARFVPVLFWRQVGCWVLYWAVLAIPFFCGAGAIGLALMVAGDRVAGVYAGNLIGSAGGAVLATVMMYLLPPAWLALVMGGLGVVGAAGLVTEFRGGGVITLAAGVGAVFAYLWVDPPRVRVDPYKYLAYLHRLERQGAAERVAVTYSPRAVVEAYRSDLFHDVPFLTGGPSTGGTSVKGGAVPPPIVALVADGHRAGSVMDINHVDQAGIVEHTLMAFAYTLAVPQPRVLLLGEAGGGNVWLAARHGAAGIDLVQPDDKVLALLRGPLRDVGGTVLDLPGVRATTAEPRHFVERTPERFDLIQLAGLEWVAAGSGGMGGLGQDHLMTVEGMVACLGRLTDDGLLFVCRGIQSPPRDNLKLLVTFVAALRRAGVEDPADHVVVVRDFQAVCTLVKASPWTDDQVARVREQCQRRNLTPVWFRGIQPDELNQPDVLPGPVQAGGTAGDWYHYAACRLFSDAGQQFIDGWPFDIRAATDDRPFFLDFCRLGSIGRFRRAFGDLWLTRTELGFLFAVTATLIIGVVGSVLTVLPLAVLRSAATTMRIAGRSATVGYFAAIGLGYLLLEMTFLSRLTHLIGDPVRAAAVTISAFLLLSGFGSLTAQRFQRTCAAKLPGIMLGLVVVGAALLIGLGRLTGLAGPLGDLGRCLVAALAVAPLAYLMGLPMPTALARIDRAAGVLVPWAWAVNGFASVLAAPLAHAIGMTWGFGVAGTVGLLLYLGAAATFGRLPRA